MASRFEQAKAVDYRRGASEAHPRSHRTGISNIGAMLQPRVGFADKPVPPAARLPPVETYHQGRFVQLKHWLNPCSLVDVRARTVLHIASTIGCRHWRSANRDLQLRERSGPHVASLRQVTADSYCGSKR